MREIKFRGWDVGFKEMESWESLLTSDVLPEVLQCVFPNLKLMQYTGLEDKNGVEIYEGDICKEEWGGIYEVEYERKRGGYFPFAHGDGCGCCDYKVVYDSKEVVVIGNIYENPELLKEGNQ